MKKIFYVTAGVYVDSNWQFNIVNQIVIAQTIDEAESNFKSMIKYIDEYLQKDKMKIKIMSIMDKPLNSIMDLPLNFNKVNESGN